jgi:hypothetical protein
LKLIGWYDVSQNVVPFFVKLLSVDLHGVFPPVKM